MANLSPLEQFELIKTNVMQEVKDYFPVQGKQQSLRLKNLFFKDDLDIEDVESQRQARLNQQTWGIPLHADIELVDNVTGKVINERKGARLLSLPKITREFAYIVNGQARSVINQFRLKSGIYAKRRQNGQISTQFNLKKGMGFDLDLQEDGNIRMAYPTPGGSRKNINLYPILRVMNLSDEEIKKEVGPEVFEVLKKGAGKDALSDVKKLHDAMHHSKKAEAGQMVESIHNVFGQTEIRPDTTKITLGEPIHKVDGRALLLSAKKMYQIAREEKDVDDMENLSFKELWSAEDHIPEKIKNSRKEILRRINNNIDRQNAVGKIINPAIFNLPIRAFFDQDNRSNMGDQTNIITMIGDHTITSLMGSGGISTEHEITPENAMINKTHMGFLDPTWTPESKRTGVVQHLPLGVRKEGREIYINVIDPKTGHPKKMSVSEMHNEEKIIALPNQYKMVNGKLSPIGDKIRARKDGVTIEVSPKQVDYILPEAMAMVGSSTATVPFLNANHGSRVMMSNKQIGQAVPLLHREPPLVQSAMDGLFSRGSGTTIEDVIGKFASHSSPVDGKVTEITKNFIKIKAPDGTEKVVKTYNNYPLNDGKTGSFIDSRPTVKVGDSVKKNQVIADTSFSKDGQLALGTNLVTAFMSSGGENFEDGVVISKSAADKMTSEHLYRFTVVLDEHTKADKKAFTTHFKNALNKDQAAKLGDNGAVQVGMKLQKGDTVIGALKKVQVGSTAEAFRKMKKVLFNPWSDASEVWNKDVDGEVTDVVHKGKYLSVYVRTKEPMKEGDKLAGRYGNKGIVVRVLDDHEMPRTKDGKHVEVLMNPTTVPTRINLGQVLETTAASKIAEKTGKRYEADLTGYAGDRSADLFAELKRHGLSDREELFDPKTGKSLGEIGVGKQYILKMRQLMDNKISVRGRDAYDINEAPKQGGKGGAQKMDSYGLYALLAHGAKDFMREKQTYTANRNDALWEALENGTPIPPPQQTFAWDKFEAMLKATGLNLDKKGNTLKVLPMTDNHIKQMSSGEIKKPNLMLFGDKEEVGGLFDAGVTGGIGGSRWSHFSLAEPIPNPIFMKPIRSLLGINQKEFLSVSTGEMGLKDGAVVPPNTPGASYGGKAIHDVLAKINVDKELSEAQDSFHSVKSSAQKDTIRKKIKYLQALKESGNDPTVYMLKTIPVLPPKFRPIAATDDGSPFRSSLNGLYKYVGMTNQELTEANKDPLFINSEKVKTRKALLGQVWKLFGAEARPFKEDRSIIPREDDDTMGILDTMAGKNPKSGFFQDAVLSKRQDLSMRAVITVGNDLEMDEIGLPVKSAMKIFEPFVKQELKRRGLTAKAQDLIDSHHQSAIDALQHVVRHTKADGTEHFHPVVMKRDPALHKFSVMGYKVRLSDTPGIRLHPLSTEGFNADFDGNCVLGDSKIVLHFPKTFCISDDASLVQKEIEMKFGKHSRVMGLFDEYLVVETEIQNVPYNKEEFCLDKNGAKVHPVLFPFSVYSYDSDMATASFEPVTHITVEDGCPVFRVKTKAGWYVDASGNESLAVFDHQEGILKRASASAESVGAFCAILPPPSTDESLFPFFGGIGFDEGWAIGSFVSDGFFMGSGRVRYAKLSDSQREKMQRIISPDQTKTYRHDASSGFGDSAKDHYTGTSEKWLAVFSDCYEEEAVDGRSALRKRLPSLWRDYSTAGKWGLLSGLLDGDGSVSKSSAGRFTVQFSTSSSYLVRDVIDLCRALGIRASFTEYKSSSKGNTAYIINLSVVDVREASVHLKLHNEKKEAVLNELCVSDLKDDRDLIPLTERELRELIAMEGLDQKKRKSLQTILSAKRNRWAVSRSTLQSLLYSCMNKDAFPVSVEMRMNSGVRWDVVDQVYEMGTHTVYDLCIPTTKVFSVNDGLVVWDTMAIFTPITKGGIEDVKKMLPSKNLFSASHGGIMHAPSQDAVWGSYQLSKWGKETDKTFATKQQAIEAYKRHEIGPNDVVKVGTIKTTAGRLHLDSLLPESIQNGRLLTDPNYLFDKGEIKKTLTRIAKADQKQFVDTVQKVLQVGNEAAYKTGRTISIRDLVTASDIRDGILKKADAVVENIKKEKIGQEEKHEKIVSVYQKATDEMWDQASERFQKSGNALYEMSKSGARGSAAQIRQMLVAPMLVQNAKSETIATPIRKSYAEGMDFGSYWETQHGARKGIVERAKGTQAPGALSKKLINSSMDMLIGGEDCGTQEGLLRPTHAEDITDRVLARDVDTSTGKLSVGTVITDTLRQQLIKDNIQSVVVRSPLKCEHGDGICAKCFGLNEEGRFHSLGTNVGVRAGQAIGEPLSQGAMNAFHEGGVAKGAGAKSLSLFHRIDQITNFPEKIHDSAPLAKDNGRVTNIKKRATGGFEVEAGGHVYFSVHPPTVKVGDVLKKGQPLSDGVVNPHDLLSVHGNHQGIRHVQAYITDEMSSLFKARSSLHRRNVETVARSLTDMVEVTDGGNSVEFYRGDRVPLSVAREMTKKHPEFKYKPVLVGANMLPLERTEDFLARANYEKIKQSFTEAATEGWKSDLHGSHPIPGLAYGKEFGKGTPDKPWKY